MTFLPLHRHAANPAPAGLDLAVAASFLPDGGLRLDYRLGGAVDQLQVPAVGPAGFADGLWQHTCCEAFVAAPDGPGYDEFNFSPSGRWAAYRFADYRQRAAAWQPPAAPAIALHDAPDGLHLVAELPAALLPAGRLHLGLSVVAEARDGGKSYWALAHAAPQPDFHLRAGFALRLERP